MFLTSLVAFGLTMHGHSETNATVKIRPAGLRVIAAGFGDEHPRPFNYPSGMTIALLVESIDKSIVSLHTQDCSLTRLADNRGKVLSSEASYFNLGLEIGLDGKRAIIEIHAAPPSPGATEITATGQIAFVVGKKAKTYEVKDAPLVKGPIAIEGLKVSVGEVGKALWGAAGTRLRLRIDGRASFLVEHIAFLDKTDKPLPARFEGLGSASYSSADNGEHSFREVYYLLPPNTTTATLQFRIWDETEPLKVPFAFTTGLGL